MIGRSRGNDTFTRPVFVSFSRDAKYESEVERVRLKE
jgi:hypothetical protein